MGYRSEEAMNTSAEMPALPHMLCLSKEPIHTPLEGSRVEGSGASLHSKSSWSLVDTRAVLFSMYTGKGLLRRGLEVRNVPRRRYGMLIARAVRGVLKIRYLLLGGAVGGGMTLNKKYAEWKDGLPDMGWLNELLPEEEQWNRFTSTLLEARDRVGSALQVEYLGADGRLAAASADRLQQLTDYLRQRYDDAKAAADSAETAPKAQLVTKSTPAVVQGQGKVTEDNSTAYEKRVQALQDEVLALQARYQKELQRLEQENRELRQQNMLLKQGRLPSARKLKKSLIDMYSSVLDELSGWEGASAEAADRLPRVVVVGDQSAGKTSVLEMIAQARIFPRGAGEMCTRAPVKVTLSEGPYHVAQFRDSSREFDLTKESDLADLRREVEIRMRNSVRGGKTVSTEVISMSVRGPGLNRMVLVDLPGVISTQTVDMASNTRDAIRQMSKQYMENPNAIILCIQDGSVDAERSNVTDLVSACDPSGKRTIFVLTKVDLAEENLANPNRIRRILEGKLFPMKALGYYAVVTGRSKKDDSIQSIREYEERFFRTSRLFKDGLVTPSQVTTRNLSLAVAECFWRMVRASVEQQADAFKALRFNLETEWKNTFPRQRELDRDELFERARAELLDASAEVASAPPVTWEHKIQETLWHAAADKLFNDIYLPAASQDELEPSGRILLQHVKHENGTTFLVDPFDIDTNKFNTQVDIKLREWAESELPALSVRAGKEALANEFRALIDNIKQNVDQDAAYEEVKKVAIEEALQRHSWEERAGEVLRVLQLNALQDRCVNSRQDWDQAVAMMENALKDKLRENEHRLKQLTGPSLKERWLYWQSTSEDQARRAEVRAELEKLGSTRPMLSYDEVVAVRDNLRRRGLEVDNEYIRDTWRPVYLKNFLQRAIVRARDCKKSYYLYHQQNGEAKECCEVVMWWRVQQTLRTTANALRQQTSNREAARLDRELREVLDEIAADPERKKQLISGRRVELAEELKRVRQVQEKLEEFIEALNKEK